MPLTPWLDTLPKAARLFYSYAVSGAATGLSANSIIEAYKVGGPGIRRRLGLEVVRRVKDIEKKAFATKYTRKDRKVSPATMPVAATDLLHDYSHKVEYTGIRIDGTPFSGYVTVATNDILTPSQILDVATEYIDLEMGDYEIDVLTGVSFEGSRKHPRFGL